MRPSVVLHRPIRIIRVFAAFAGLATLGAASVLACSSFDAEIPAIEDGSAPPDATADGDVPCDACTDAPTSGEAPLAIASGNGFACALRASGHVWCWGDNQFGAIGVPPVGDDLCDPATKRCRPLPTEVSGLDEVVQLAVGNQFACARRKNGRVWCWGKNEAGTLGNGSAEPKFRASPAEIQNLAPAFDIVAGESTACASVREPINSGDGGPTESTRIYCWGNNVSAMIGQPPSNQIYPPTLFPQLTNAKQVRLSLSSGNGCAIRSDDTIVCWGLNTRGILGHVDPIDAGADSGIDDKCFYGPCRAIPTRVGPANFTLTSLTVGQGFACGSRADELVYCWGSNEYGGLGVGSVDVANHTQGVGVPGISKVKSVTANGGHACALSDGKLRCWGMSGWGELADGITGQGCGLVRCQPTPQPSSTLDGILDVATGVAMTMVRTETGTFAWGLNADGRLGHRPSTMNDQLGGCTGNLLCNPIAQPVVLP